MSVDFRAKRPPVTRSMLLTDNKKVDKPKVKRKEISLNQIKRNKQRVPFIDEIWYVIPNNNSQSSIIYKTLIGVKV